VWPLYHSDPDITHDHPNADKHAIGANVQPQTVILALGTNLGDKEQNLQTAIRLLWRQLHNIQASPLYETEPWGITDQPSFLNQVIMGTTTQSPFALLRFLLEIEQEMGRERIVRFGPRLIDLDIIFYDNLILTSYDLTIPHPRMIERSFVLAPLADIAPDWVHPRLGCTVKQLLSRVDASTAVRIDSSSHLPGDVAGV